MKEIPRATYLNRLIESRGIHLIKIITGLRRSGKSYLLDPIFRNFLLKDGVSADHIIHLNLEEDKNKHLRDATKLREYVESKIKDDGQYYVLLDEIQLVPEFEGVLSGFLAMKNVDTYVTGSNSRFLSSDIVTEFRGRSEQIHMYPLSFKEFYSVYEGEKLDAWTEYMKYGGLPLVLEHKSESSKMDYLIEQQKNIYLKDLIERYDIKNDVALKSLIQVIASSVGSLTNPYKLENAFKSMTGVELSYNTIGTYLNRLQDAFIIEESKRYDVKGKKYINTPQKYYFSDIGLRNSFLGFPNEDQGHIMENIIYNELRMRGYQVDVGVVEVRDGSNDKKQLEIDFVANRGDRRYYIQSALNITNMDKMEQEARSLKNVNDFFRRFIITADFMRPGYERDGVVVMNVLDFLLNEDSLDKEV